MRPELGNTPVVQHDDIVSVANGRQAMLIDQGDTLGYDKVPPSGAPLFVGTAPDIGARESGGAYSFGNVQSLCP